MADPKKPRRSAKGSSASISGTEIKRKFMSAFRQLWSYHDPERKLALQLSRVETPRLKLDGTPAKIPDVSYRCFRCQGLFKDSAVNVDHIEAVGKEPSWPITGDGRWEKYLMRLFCHRDNYQVLCRICHTRKTMEDNNAATGSVPKV